MYDECFSKTMKEQIIHIVRYRGPIGLAWVQVRCKTVVLEAWDQHDEILVADLCVCGVWLRCYLLLISHIYAIHRAVFLMLKLRKNKYTDVCFCLYFTPLFFC